MIKRILLAAALSLLVLPVFAQEQNTTTYDMVKSDKEEEVIYKGPVTFEDIAGVKAFDLEQKAAAYKPAPAAMEALSERLGDYRLVIFLGTWCDDSHRMIPQLYRVLKDADYPLEDLQMYALDHEKKGKNGEEKTFRITNVPTIVVLKGDKEIGRITEVVDKSVESDLLKLLGKE